MEAQEVVVDAEKGSSGSAPVLELRDALKARQQGGAGFELRIPDFCLNAGEFVAVVGESGCGKSTLLDMLALVLRPTHCHAFRFHEPGYFGSGATLDIAAIWQAGAERELARVRRTHLGYVLQTGGLLPFLSVLQNIQLPAKVKGAPLSLAKIEELAERMGVASVMGKKPQFLSGGQRQRVAILRALVHEPTVVLADEPTAAVDKERARAIVADFTLLARERGSTIVMVTHDPTLVAGVADRAFGFKLTQPSGSLTRSVCAEL